jgi:hypothetical protein
MGRKTVIPKYTNLGGLILQKNDPLLEGNEAMVADNVIFSDKWGMLRQRTGFNARLGSPVTGDRIRLIHQHVDRQSGAKTRLIIRGNTISRILDANEFELDTGLSPFSNVLGASAQLFDDSILCTGADQPRVFNTLGLNTIDTGDFEPQWCLTYANYMVYGGDSTLPQRIVFSALGDATSVEPLVNFIDILGSGKLTGAFTLFNSLYVLSIDTITKIDGSDFTAESPGFDAQVRSIWKGTGSVNHQSITVVHDRAYFLGRYGVYEFDGRQVVEISDVVQNFFTDRLNRSVIDSTVSVHDEENNLVIFSIPSVNSSVPNTHVVYHYEAALVVWSSWSDFTSSFWYEMEETGDFPIIWHGDENGQVFRHGQEADDNFIINVPTAIKFRYKTGWQHLNGPAKRFIPKHFYPIIDGIAADTFTIGFFTNYGSGFAAGFPKVITIPSDGPIWGVDIWGEFTWGGSEAQYADTIGISASVIRNFALEFTHEAVGKKFAIIGWTTTVIAKGLTDGSQ